MGTSQSMSIFVDPQRVLTRLQVQPAMLGVQDVIVSALVGAQKHIESILDTQLGNTPWDITYWLDRDAHSGIHPGGQYRMYLPSGFVRSDTPIQLWWDSDWRMTNMQLINPVNYRIDYLRGMIYLDEYYYANDPVYLNSSTRYQTPNTHNSYYVRVTCSTGFNQGVLAGLPSDPSQPWPDAYLPEAIPDWLEESIISYVGIVLDVSQTTNNAPQAKDQYKRAGDHAVAILSPYIRKRGMTYLPMSW